jgi:hypothetical protein
VCYFWMSKIRFVLKERVEVELKILGHMKNIPSFL